jgi:hypothetical protein
MHYNTVSEHEHRIRFIASVHTVLQVVQAVAVYM